MDTEIKLRFLPIFYTDLERMVDYISCTLANPDAADDLVSALFNAIDRRLPIAENFEPFHSSYEPELPYYHIRVKNFMIFYVVLHENKQQVMEVRRLLYNKRNWQEMNLSEETQYDETREDFAYCPKCEKKL